MVSRGFKKKENKERTFWVWDDEVADCFDLWADGKQVMDGQLCARYFEAIRYRQQLTRGQFFPFKSDRIRELTGLTYKKQLQARRILEGSGWIEVRNVRRGRGTVLEFLVTKLAKESIGHIKHPQDMDLFMQQAYRNSGLDLSKWKSQSSYPVYK